MEEQEKRDVMARLRSIEGHLRGIERMVEADAYCVDIIKQTLAVQRAIDKVNTLILGHHLKTCVTTAIQSNHPAERERVITELMDIFETSSKL